MLPLRSALSLSAALAAVAPSVSAQELVVTAQRRAQNIQDVSVAITAIRGEELTRQGITVVNQLEQITPNFEVEQAFGGGQPQFRLRGVGFEDYAANNTPTVGIYVDEVAIPVPVMTQGLLFDLERVEVLRGPQGTLYGRNTTGGAINFITVKPSLEGGASGLTVSFGRFERLNAEGFFNLPVNDAIALRVAVAHEQGGGWQRDRVTGREIGDLDRSAVRGQLYAELNEQVSALLALDYQVDNSDGRAASLLRRFTSPALPAGQSIPADTDHRSAGWGTDPFFAALIGISPDQQPFRDNDLVGGRLRLTWDLGEDIGELVAISGYQDLDRREYNDWDGTALSEAEVFFNGNSSVFSQEVRLASTGDRVFDYLGGIYYSTQEQDEQFLSAFLQERANGLDANTSYTQDVETFGVFGQVEFQATEQINLVGGLRYETETRDLNNLTTFARIPIGGGQAFILPVVGPQNRSVELDELTGRAAIEFTPNADTLFYASVSRGAKSGGFAANNTLDPRQADPFEAEKLWAYEIGGKIDLPEAGLRINAAAYYYDYEDQQVFGFFPGSVLGGPLQPIGRFFNAEESEIYGAELELTWTPPAIEGLTVTQTLGYKEGEYTDFLDRRQVGFAAGGGLGPVLDRSGEEIDFPNLSYAGAASYAAELEGFAVLAGFDYSYRDDSSANLLNLLARQRAITNPAQYGTVPRDIFEVEGYWLVNAQVSVGPVDGPWELSLYGRNIFDEEYDETRNCFNCLSSEADVAFRGEPASYGVRADFRF